jgi:hypothetical protein
VKPIGTARLSSAASALASAVDFLMFVEAIDTGSSAGAADGASAAHSASAAVSTATTGRSTTLLLTL